MIKSSLQCLIYILRPVTTVTAKTRGLYLSSFFIDRATSLATAHSKRPLQATAIVFKYLLTVL